MWYTLSYHSLHTKGNVSSGLKSSSHSTYKIDYHIVWCTKFRHKVLVEAVEVAAKRIISETCVAYGWQIPSLEVMPDHVHCFVQAPPTVAPVDIVRTLKSVSAVGIFTRFPQLKGRKFWGTGLWSKGYYVGTVGDMSEDVVRKYIDSQHTKG